MTATFLTITCPVLGTYSEVESATECKLCKKGSFNDQAENTDCKVRSDYSSDEID